MQSICSIIALLLALMSGNPASARTAQPQFMGTWLIAEAHPAPWVVPGDPSTAPADAGLVGKTITYRKTRIAAPPLLACDRPRYRMRRVPPEGLFQGGLTAPAQQAAALGFRSRPIATLETGCEGWFDYHFTDAGTAMFALDNMIYVMRRP